MPEPPFAINRSGVLEAAVLPDTVTEIGGGAFSDCPRLVISASAGSAAIEHAKRKKIRRGSL